MSVTFFAHTERGPIRQPLTDQLNLANENAAAVLRCMRLGNPEHVFSGESSIPGVRRAVMYALGTWDRRSKKFVREEEIGPRVVIFGLTPERLRERIERFARFVEWAEGQGATFITWG